jgi:hypothetical protein
MRVNPETWTHGSARQRQDRQRQEWYLVGWNTADMNRCNTFSGMG